MHMGGIQTLILRFGSYFKSKGFRLKVILTFEGGELIEELQKTSEVKILNLNELTCSVYVSDKIIKNDIFFANIDEVYSMYAGGNWLGLQIANKLEIPFKVGIYHPEDYKMFSSMIDKKIFDIIPDTCKLFMNQENLVNHEKIYGRTIEGNIWQLPVIFDTGGDYKINTVLPSKNKIISIGRFDPYKTYNLTMIKTISDLKKIGINLIYEIYGYGVLEDKMISLIKQYDLSENIIIKGVLNYKDFKNIVSNAYLFVGCGTSVIEASYFGVPSIVATAESNGQSNGLFSDEIGFNVGEKAVNILPVNAIDQIINILNLSDDEYLKLKQKHTDIAKERYSVNIVFDKYFMMPNHKIQQSFKLKLLIILSALYFNFYKRIKLSTIYKYLILIKKRIIKH